MEGPGGMRGAVALVALLSVVAQASAFATDAQQESLGLERPGRLKRTVRSFLSDDEKKDGGRGLHLGPLFPRLDIVSTGAGPAPTLHFWAPAIGGTPVDVHASASYSVHKYQYYDLQVGLVSHEAERLPRVERGSNALFPLSDIEKNAAVPGFNIYASARHRDYPREDFYGIGTGSRESAHSDYRLKDGLYEGIARLRIARLSVMVRAGVLQTSIGAGGDAAFPSTGISNGEATAPGLVRAPDFVHVSGAAWLELRDEPGNPHRGASLGLAFSRYDDRKGNSFQFNRTLADAREYIPLGSTRSVVALRQVASLDQPDAGSRVPFYMHSTLGGSALLRGYNSFRFRDYQLLALVGEYRFELQPKLELALIYESAKVFATMSAFNFHDMRDDWGVGVRLKSRRAVRLRLDAFHGAEGTKVRVRLGPSF
jgi:Omp85 superfamily domain